MNVRIVTKRLQFIFGEIKNVQSSESPSEFLRNSGPSSPDAARI